MKTILLVICILFVCSCITQKKCFERFPPQLSSQTETVYRDTTIHIDTSITLQGDSVIILQKIPCPDVNLYGSKKSDKGLQVDYKISGGQLAIKAKYDSLQAVIKDLQIKLQQKSIIQKSVEIHQAPPIEIPKRYIPKWVWFLIASNIVALLFKLVRIYFAFKPF